MYIQVYGYGCIVLIMHVICAWTRPDEDNLCIFGTDKHGNTPQRALSFFFLVNYLSNVKAFVTTAAHIGYEEKNLASIRK